MKRFWLTLVLCLTCAFCAVGFAACGGVEFKINFVVDGEIYATVGTNGAETVKMPENPKKNGYTFDGWFWDKDVWEKPFTANSLLDAPLSSDMSVYAKFTSNHTHAYTEQITKEPTCTEKGEKTFTCACGDSYTEEINALGHEFTNYISDNNATIYQDGTKTAVCDRGCGATDTVIDEGTKLPEITEYFDKQQNGSYYGKVYNTTKTFDFTGKIDYDGEYFVCTDAACTRPLADNKTSLNVGDNTFYILFDNGNKTTATVRRRAICTVTFDTANGTTVATQTVEEDKRTPAPKNPMRVGYTFNAWDRDFNEPITANTTITAIWNANTNTPYKIEYYLQNLENDNYTLQENDTEYLTGTTDTTATATKTYEHFTVVANTASANIKPDGTTVLQVKYTRDKYSYTAQNENTKGGTITCTKNGTYKYGTQITLSATLNAGYDFLGWYNGDKKLSDEFQYTFNIAENNNVIAKYFTHTDTPYKIEYYLQNLENDNYTLQENDTEYLASTTDTTANAEIKMYEHFTYNKNKSTISGNINGDGLTALKVYYTRDKYTVKTLASNDSVTLNNTFNGQYKYGYIIPEITTTVNLGYDWQGWYSDDEFMTNDTVIPSFTIDRNINYVAHCSLKAEMSNFNFTSTAIVCTITGIKDKTVTEIIVPDYVTSIGDSAFYSCSSLTSITIGNSVTSIGYGAFRGCSGLTNITIPDSVTNIGNNAFYDCSSLTSITIGNSVTGIGSYAFRDCNSLTNITIPDSVTSIGSYAFLYCRRLMSITIGTSVIRIYDGAFNWCYRLIEVFNKSSLNITAGNSDYGSLGYYAKNIYTPTNGASKPITQENGYIIYDGNILVGYDGTETELSLPDGITEINQRAFYDCRRLTSITIPDSVTSIGEQAFSDCSGLTSVTIPNSVTSIGNRAFHRCSKLTSVTYNGTTAQWQAISKGSEWRYNVSSSCVVHCTDGDINIANA